MPRYSAPVLALARRGAELRIKELQAEIAQLRKAFLRLPFGSAASPAIPARKREIEVAKPRRQRRRMSAAQRKAVSERMRAYWRARRKAKNAGSKRS